MDVPQGEPVAALKSVDFDKLLSGDSESVKDLVQAAKVTGFFYLDLRGLRSRGLIREAQLLLDFSSRYFSQPRDIKSRHSRPGVERGYKTGAGHESFEIARDELSNAELAFPDLWQLEKEKLAHFTNQCDWICKCLLETLSKSMEMQSTSLLGDESHGRLPSDSGLKFISSPTMANRKDAPDTTHTDSGVLTLLWATQLSSQILDPLTNRWSWVETPDGHTLVNVADTLQRESDGRFKSCTHRVTQPKGFCGPRHFLSYYLRPGLVAEDGLVH